jgi:hypothetical protein
MNQGPKSVREIQSSIQDSDSLDQMNQPSRLVIAADNTCTPNPEISVFGSIPLETQFHPAPLPRATSSRVREPN